MDIECTEWEVYTGRLIISFGDIELLTYKLFDIWLPDKKVKKYGLSRRLNDLISYIGNLPEKSNKKESINDLLTSIKRLKAVRNRIAHNPIVLERFGNSKYESVVKDLRGKDISLSLEQLHEFADEAESIKSALYIAVSQYTNRGIDELLT